MLAVATAGPQVPDVNFDVSVTQPAAKGTKVLFDEAHHNFHTTEGRYQPFAGLMRNDGCVITPNREPFTPGSLKPHRLLVIANALRAAIMGAPEAGNPAFTERECAAVRDWIRGGCALLLIADHAPMGAAVERLAREFGVVMSNAYTSDPVHFA